jgi:hypothetical protein
MTAFKEKIASAYESVHLIKNIKDAFHHFSDLEMLSGISTVTETGGHVLSAGFSLLGAYSIVDVFNNKKISPAKKILPILGYSLAVIAGTATAIVAIAGASTLLPPFIFAGACVSVFKNITSYLEVRAERNLLRKELMTSPNFQQFVSKKIPKNNQATILKYAYLPQEIFQLFYDLRDQINTLDIPLSEKENIILRLYQNMEDFGEGKACEITLDDPQLPDAMKTKKQTLSLLLSEFESAKKIFNELDLNKSTKNQINSFKITQEKISCQDIPVSIKKQVITLLGNKKNNKRQIADLYQRIGHDYLNQHPSEQINHQETEICALLTKLPLPENQVSLIIDYMKQPRDIYDSLMHFKSLLKNSPKGDLIALYLNFPTPETVLEINSYLESINNPTILSSDTFLLLQSQAQKYQETATQYNRLKANLIGDHSRMTKLIDTHHFQSLNQYTNSYQRFSGSPHVVIPVKEYNLGTHLFKKIKQGTQKQYNAFKKQAQNDTELSPLLTQTPPYSQKSAASVETTTSRLSQNDMPQPEFKKEKNKNKNKIKKQFKNEKGYTFELIATRERLGYLEKAAPRYIVNIFLSLGVAVISLASTLILPAVASPAAPVSIAVGAALSVLTVAVVSMSLANSLDLLRVNLQQKYKVHKTKSDISTGVTPSYDLDREKELLDQLNARLEANRRKENQSDSEEDKSTFSMPFNIFKRSQKNKKNHDESDGESDTNTDKTGESRKEHPKS